MNLIGNEGTPSLRKPRRVDLLSSEPWSP